MALHTKTDNDIELLKSSMARYNRAVMRNDMVEVHTASEDCRLMIAVIMRHGDNYKPKVRLKECTRSLDNTKVTLYDHVFINGLRYSIPS